MKITIGGGIDQKTILTNLEAHLGTTAKRTAELLETSYNTYKEWKGNRRNILGTTLLAINMLTDIAGTEIGKEYGV